MIATRSWIRWRRFKSALGWTLSGAAFLALAVAMIQILFYVFAKGFKSLSFKLFAENTIGVGGGLKNAILGTLLLSGTAMILAALVGVAAGLYLSEYGEGRMASLTRFLSDVLVGVPSIVLGFVGYVTLTVWLKWRFSLAAGAITLAVLMLPYIVRSTELALRRVASGIRESAYALGCRDHQVVFKVLLKAAAPGIGTGILLALAISAGETAPLLYTAGWSNYGWSGRLIHEPVAYLTYVIWSFIGEPFHSAHALAYAAAFLITALILLINLIARLLIATSPHGNR
ncbi:phosphate ABC transporter, inner membrane subunit PstA [mine drainage metagenome]|uniref:Phosphate ABC transporter, inner membrane subunit PstA n=1 Tax=mine drainage metagenome TaxID=410659 RepID=T1AA82_9ZZZZ